MGAQKDEKESKRYYIIGFSKGNEKEQNKDEADDIHEHLSREKNKYNLKSKKLISLLFFEKIKFLNYTNALRNNLLGIT